MNVYSSQVRDGRIRGSCLLMELNWSRRSLMMASGMDLLMALRCRWCLCLGVGEHCEVVQLVREVQGYGLMV